MHDSPHPLAVADHPGRRRGRCGPLRPCHLVHIGDDVVTDLLGALEAGARAILISRPELMPRTAEQVAQMPTPDPSRWREVANLREAVAVVLEWQAEARQP